MSGKKVLIVGGTGVISTGIVRALLAKGDQVTVFNRGKTGSRLGAMAGGDGVRVIHGDRNDKEAFEKGFAGQSFDAVIDMICFNAEQAESDLRAFAGRTGHLIFCSTVCTYGNTQTVIPTLERTPQEPHTDYGRNKLGAERVFLEAYHGGKLGGAGLTIFRPSHTYGPGAALINNLGGSRTFIDRIRKGKRILVSGDGHGLWQSAYCDDVGVGFAYAAGRKRTFGEAYNIVGDEKDWFTWDQYVQRIAKAIGAPEPRLVHVPTELLAAADAARYGGLTSIFRYHGVYANAKLRRDVPEFSPSTSLEEGVRKTVAWMVENGQVEDSDKDGVDDAIADAMEGVAATIRAKLGAKQ